MPVSSSISGSTAATPATSANAISTDPTSTSRNRILVERSNIRLTPAGRERRPESAAGWASVTTAPYPEMDTAAYSADAPRDVLHPATALVLGVQAGNPACQDQPVADLCFQAVAFDAVVPPGGVQLRIVPAVPVELASQSLVGLAQSVVQDGIGSETDCRAPRSRARQQKSTSSWPPR